MITQTQSSFGQKAVRLTLSTAGQSAIYLSLSTLILWTVYFTTYPAIHDKVHSLRHHTAAVSCH